MKKPSGMFLLSVSMMPVTVHAQTRNENWNVGDVTMQASAQCNLPPTFISVTRNLNGSARVQASPSLSSTQVDCVRNVVARLGIAVRGTS